MEVKRIKPETMNNIIIAAEAIGKLETGCRNCVKERAKAFFTLCNTPSAFRYTSNIPSTYAVYFMESVNLGTRKYSDYYTDYNTFRKTETTTVRETDCSYIFEDGKWKKVIRKDRLVCFVF